MDVNRGVWKSLAGLETVINGTTGVVDLGVMTDGNRSCVRVSSGATVSLNHVTQFTLTGNLVSNEIVDTPPATQSPVPREAAETDETIDPVTSEATTAETVTNPSVVLQSPSTEAIAALVAVTGNVPIGDEPVLPTQRLAEPFDVWTRLNTIAAYVAPAT
ncbi:MAG: hypothetical protein ACLP0J_22045 [Solirubrobacteraceae bacterium]